MDTTLSRKCLFSLFAIVAPSVEAQPMVNARTNILIIVADDIGVDLLPSYGLGSDLPETPNLDALASEGVLFRNAWSNPVCSSTRATILTGRYSFRTGVGFVVDSTFSLLAGELTIPEVLDQRATGYSHAAFGKWHLSNDASGGINGPNDAGFSHYSGWLGNLNFAPLSYFNWPQIENGVISPASGYITTRTVDDAVSWIQSASEPWFCYVAFQAVHDPFHTPPAELYKVDLSGVGDPSVEPRPHYKAMVEAMDYEIGSLLEGIGSLGNTTVIFIGDNGTPTDVTVPPFLPSHAKATVYQGGIQVPLIIKSPLVNQNGSECLALVSTVDLFATAVELAGAHQAFDPAGSGSLLGSGATPETDLPAYTPATGVNHDGVSLVPYLRDSSKTSIREYVFSEWFFPNGFGTPYQVRRAIREERYKYTFNDPPNPSPEFPNAEGASAGEGEERTEGLYDLLLDPFELTNLMEKPSLNNREQKAFDRLTQELAQILQS